MYNVKNNYNFLIVICNNDKEYYSFITIAAHEFLLNFYYKLFKKKIEKRSNASKKNALLKIGKSTISMALIFDRGCVRISYYPLRIKSMWNTMKCKKDSFSGALGGARETHWECVSHRLNVRIHILMPPYTYFLSWEKILEYFLLKNLRILLQFINHNLLICRIHWLT